MSIRNASSVFFKIFSAVAITASLPHYSNLAAQSWQQDLHYTIEAEIDTTAKALRGYLSISYRNNSPDTLNSLFFLVPANAYSNAENTAFREMSRINRSGIISFSQRHDSELKITTLQFLSIGAETEFPIQAFDFSDTVLDLPLPVGLAPGDSLSLGMAFSKDYKRRLSQKKRGNIYITFTNWFPRIAAYTKAGWQVEPFHFLMESMDVLSEFAKFDVTLTVPGQYIVVAPGKNLSGDPGWRGVKSALALEDSLVAAWHDSLKKAMFQQAEKTGVRKTIWRVKKAQTFTWTASPNLIYYDRPRDFPVHMIARGAHNRHWEKIVSARLDTLFSLFEPYFGKLPGDELVILESRESNLSQPGLAMLPEDGHFSLAQAFSSMYMPSMLATNGYDEAWMAKGFGVFLGKKAAERAYGSRGYEMEEAQEEMSWWQKRYPLPTFDQILRNMTLLYRESGQDEAISQKADAYNDPVGLFANTYMKSSLFYEMLEYVVGVENLQRIMRTFFERHKFTYVTEEDLQAVSEEVFGQNLDWFFAQWLHGTPTVDYAKGKVTQYQKEDKTWVTEVEVRRNGDGIMPVEIEIETGDGGTVVQRWDGKDKIGKVVFETASKPRGVKVDPKNRILDSNMLNNGRTRLEFKPDFPLLRLVYMPSDAYLVLWRPRLGYNSVDGLRLGVQTRGSFRSFYNNLDLTFDFGLKSKTLDGKVAYSHPLRRSNLLNRYRLLARKFEGRYEMDARLSFNGSDGIVSPNGRGLDFGMNFSGVRNLAYTLRTVASDSGNHKFQEWEDARILTAHLDGNWRRSYRAWHHDLQARVETALPGSEAKFTKLSARLKSRYKTSRVLFKARGNAGTSFGADDLPLQDSFRAEGASPRERFRNNQLPSGRGLSSFSRRYVEGGGNLRGYAGQPLLANRYLSANFEFGLTRKILLLRWFGFYDTGKIWRRAENETVTLSNAGVGATFSGDISNFFGGNLPLFEALSLRLYFPLWLNTPPPGEKNTQFRWYFSLGKQF